MRFFLCLLLLLLLLLVGHHHRCATAAVSVPHVDSSNRISVFYLEAPLFKVKFGDLLAKADLYHTGIGLMNRDTGDEWTVDYVASTSVLDSVFPKLGSGNDSLVWLDAGHVNVSSGIDRNYWTRYYPMYETTGDVFNRFMCFLPTYNETNSNYLLFSIYNSTKPVEAQIDDPIHESSTCVDFCWVALHTLHNLGATTSHKNESMERDLMYLTVKEKPVKVNMNNPAEKAAVLSFYQKFQFDNVTWDEMLRRTLELFQGEWYYHYRNQKQDHFYYKIKLDKPYMGVKYEFVDIPSDDDPRDPGTVGYTTRDPVCARYAHSGIPAHIILIVLGSTFAAFCCVGVVMVVASIVISSVIIKRRKKIGYASIQ